jgi:hypothetical protein
MTHDERYESWKRRRARAEVPADFADRVLSAVHAHEQRPARRLARGLVALATSQPGRAAIWALALVLFAVRLISVLAIFLTGVPTIGE